MDLRRLYEMILGNNHIRKSIRVNINKKCFLITYEISNKFLKVNSIKRVPRLGLPKSPKLAKSIYVDNERSKYYKKNFGKKKKSRLRLRPYFDDSSLSSKKYSILRKISTAEAKVQTPDFLSEPHYADPKLFKSSTSSKASNPCEDFKPDDTLNIEPEKPSNSESENPLSQSISTQTLGIRMTNKFTEVESVLSFTKGEQTSILVYTGGTQTEPLPKIPTSHCGINVKPLTCTTANQTVNVYCHMYTETSVSSKIAEVQTEDTYHAFPILCQSFNDHVFDSLGKIEETLDNQTGKFDNFNKSAEEILDWVNCFKQYFKMRKKKFVSQVKKIETPNEPSDVNIISETSSTIDI